MIIKGDINYIERSGDFQSESFECDPFVMTLLRNSIYGDKITAAIREPLTNSFDAHIEAGIKDVPVDIYMPSILEPTFRIRDYGKSMSNELVSNIYRVYGRSTKRDSNKSAGGFGVGKMAPMCYTESNFQLVCIQGKVKRIYSIYIDETGKDSLDLLFTGETDEVDGTEVSFPVKQSDINTFKSKLENLLRFWPVYPNIHNCENFQKIVPLYFLLREGNWGFLSEQDMYRRGSFIVCGPIAYKLDQAQIPDITELQKKILDKNLVIFAGIGDVALQASRESVAYNSQTIQFIKSRLKTIEDEIRAEADKKQATVSSEFEARKLYYDLFNTSGQFGVLAELFKTYIEVKWSTKTITSVSFPLPTFKGYEAELAQDRSYNVRTKIKEYTDYDGWPIIQLMDMPDTRFFYDTKRLSRGKLRNLARYYLREKKFFNKTPIYIIQVDSVEQFNQICLDKGIPANIFKDINIEVVIPKLPRPPREVGTSYNCRAFDPEKELDDDNNEKFDSLSVKTEIDFENHEGGYYLLRHYSDYFFGGYKAANIEISELWAALIKFDPEFKDHPVIYTFPTKYTSKLSSKWKRIDESLTLFIPAYEELNKRELINLESLKNAPFLHLLNGMKNKLNIPELKDILSSIDFNNSFSINEFNAVKRAIGIEAVDKSVNGNKLCEINNKIETIHSWFPLLKFVDDDKLSGPGFAKSFLEYANAILVERKQIELAQDQVTA